MKPGDRVIWLRERGYKTELSEVPCQVSRVSGEWVWVRLKCAGGTEVIKRVGIQNLRKEI